MEQTQKTIEFAVLPPEKEQSYRKALAACSIHMIRGFGRVLGVKQASAMDKEPCIDAIVDVRFGRTPAHRTNLGPRPKKDWTEDFCRFERDGGFSPDCCYDFFAPISAPTFHDCSDGDFSGYVCLTEQGALIYNAYFERIWDGVIPPATVSRYRLRTGDYVTFSVADGKLAVTEIDGLKPGARRSQPDFETWKSVYPQKKLAFGVKGYEKEFARLCPLGHGQRALAVYQDVYAKSGFLRGASNTAAYDGDCMIGVMLESRTEESESLRSSYDVFVSVPFGEEPEEMVHAVQFAFGVAQRKCEGGRSTVVIIDNFDHLLAALSETEGDEKKAMRALKRLMNQAKATDRGVALTMIALCTEELCKKLESGANAVINFDKEKILPSSYVLDGSPRR